MDTLREMRAALAANDAAQVEQYFDQTAAARREWLKGTADDEDPTRQALKQAGKDDLRRMFFGGMRRQR